MKTVLTVSGSTLAEILESAKTQFDHFFHTHWYKMTPLATRPSATTSNDGGVGPVILWETDFEAESRPEIPLKLTAGSKPDDEHDDPML